MDNVTDKIADLDKRIAHQEKIHEKVESDPNYVHGVVKDIVVVVLSSAFITMLGVSAYLMTKSNNN